MWESELIRHVSSAVTLCDCAVRGWELLPGCVTISYINLSCVLISVKAIQNCCWAHTHSSSSGLGINFENYFVNIEVGAHPISQPSDRHRKAQLIFPVKSKGVLNFWRTGLRQMSNGLLSIKNMSLPSYCGNNLYSKEQGNNWSANCTGSALVWSWEWSIQLS
jgi:hypothetical protein